MLKHLLSLILPLSTLLSAAEFKVEKSAFALDGKPFQIHFGEAGADRRYKEYRWKVILSFRVAVDLCVSGFLMWRRKRA